MKLLRSAVLYLALVAGANAQAIPEALREGDMRKLVLHEEPVPVPDVVFTDPQGGEFRLSDWKGRHVLLNFWATWCAPCRKEMPSLDALERERGGEDFAVLPVATGRNPPAAIRRFYEETGVTSLPVLLDPRQDLARRMAVLGLPVTVILDPEGREIARLLGEADWNGSEAQAVLDALIGAAAGG